MKKVVSLALICLVILSVVYGWNVMSVFEIKGDRTPHKKLVAAFEIDGNRGPHKKPAPDFEIDGNRGPHK